MICILALSVPFWFEWELTHFLSIKIGLIDIIALTALCRCLFLKRETKTSSGIKIPYIKTFSTFTFFMIVPLFLDFQDIFRIFWAIYKLISFNIIYLIVFYCIQKKDDIKKLISLLLFSTSIASIIGILQTMTGNPIDFLSVGTYASSTEFNAGYWLPRAWGSFRAPNEFAGFLIWPISITLGILITSNDRKKKRRFLSMLLIQITAFIITQSRSGLLGMMISFSIIVFLLKNRKSIVIIIFGLLIFGLIHAMLPRVDLIPGDLGERFRSIFTKGTKAHSMTPRYQRWNFFLNEALQNPLGKKKVSQEAIEAAGITYAETPHNTYLHLALKFGIGGLIAAFLILCGLLKTAYKISKKSKDNFTKGLTVGVFAGGVGFMFHSFFEVLWSQWQTGVLIWFMLGIIMAIEAKNLYNLGRIQNEDLANS